MDKCPNCESISVMADGQKEFRCVFCGYSTKNNEKKNDNLVIFACAVAVFVGWVGFYSVVAGLFFMAFLVGQQQIKCEESYKVCMKNCSCFFGTEKEILMRDTNISDVFAFERQLQRQRS